MDDIVGKVAKAAGDKGVQGIGKEKKNKGTQPGGGWELEAPAAL